MHLGASKALRVPRMSFAALTKKVAIHIVQFKMNSEVSRHRWETGWRGLAFESSREWIWLRERRLVKRTYQKYPHICDLDQEPIDNDAHGRKERGQNCA